MDTNQRKTPPTDTGRGQSCGAVTARSQEESEWLHAGDAALRGLLAAGLGARLGAAFGAVPLSRLVLELGALCQRQLGKRDVGLGGGYDGVGEAEFNALCPVGELVAVPYGGADFGGELLPLFRPEFQVVRFEVHALMIPEGIVERNTPRSIYLWVLERPEFSHAR
jgi:hypothetical protein